MFSIKFPSLSFLLSTFILASFVPAANSSASSEMIEIPAGEFKSGPNQKVVSVDKFSIDKYSVTNDDFRKFKKGFDAPAGKEKHPAVEVSYFEAEEYCKSVGKRLPTALEREKAARGTDGRLYPWGNNFEKEKSNTMESDRGETVEVGSIAANKSPFGVMDMSGNVWEWVAAWEGKDQQYRLMMGGSYFDDKEKGKVFSSIKSIPDDSHPYIGFRCAK